MCLALMTSTSETVLLEQMAGWTTWISFA